MSDNPELQRMIKKRGTIKAALDRSRKDINWQRHLRKRLSEVEKTIKEPKKDGKAI